jgi:sulfite exporter TauE/SafE
MIDNQLIAAFIVGLLGSGHCVGMCGSLASALLTGNTERSFLRSLALSVGRCSSYAIAGALVATAALSLSSLLAIKQVIVGFQLLAGVMVILAGLYVAGWYMGLSRLESLGKGIWLKLQPIARRCLPINSMKSAFGYGLIWGWLPCGLVYSTLTWTLSAGSAVQGAAIMLAFGCGTLPAMVAVGTFAEQIKRMLKNKNLRCLFGIIVISLGLLTIYGALDRSSWF